MGSSGGSLRSLKLLKRRLQQSQSQSAGAGSVQVQVQSVGSVQVGGNVYDRLAALETHRARNARRAAIIAGIKPDTAGLEASEELTSAVELQRELVALQREALELERERKRLDSPWWVRAFRWIASLFGDRHGQGS